MINSVDMFRIMLPSDRGSKHAGEEGRYVEHIFAEFLRANLPSAVEVGTGFVLDIDRNLHSYQVDILVYDRLGYAPYIKYGDAVIVPKEAVIAAISIKKVLRIKEVAHESKSLGHIGEICGGFSLPRPYLALVGIDSERRAGTNKSMESFIQRVFGAIQRGYPDRAQGYCSNELIDAVVVLEEFLIKKTSKKENSPKVRKSVDYRWFGGSGIKRSTRAMAVLHGIEKVLAERDAVRSERPTFGLTPRSGSKLLGSIPIKFEDRKYINMERVQKKALKKEIAHLLFLLKSKRLLESA
ncbi:DUF6602 domain-containing protein [Kocuria sp. CPCC 205263]|uniref:DUF6602 domain-containing protein n=1 Tax=Kocuria sp. CPCC 205263 TaxID=3073555 RepID=UPI0034D63393